MSGGNVNIGGSNDDASYRYKMPRLVTKIEGRGNGIKTVIVNMSDIAKALHIDPSYPTKFFGVELGAQSKYDKANDKAVVNGAHNAKDLANLLTKFIEIFILCPNCHLPETTMTVKKGIKVDCAACGYNDVLRTDHKLSTYILKNPPAASAKMKKVKENVKSREADDAVEEAKTKKVETKVKKSAKKSDGGDDVVWFTDTSEEAQKARQLEEMASMGISGAVEDRIQNIMESESSGNTLDDKAVKEALKEFIEEKKGTSNAEIVSELRRIQLARNLPDPEKYSLLLEAVLDASQPKTIVAQIEANASLLKSFTGSPDKERLFIGAVEKYLGADHKDVLMNRVLLIFQALYDQEILEEENILAWHASPADTSFRVDESVAKSLREKVDKFIEWLQAADEDEEGDEEEE
jgi:translation initiation factor 5